MKAAVAASGGADSLYALVALRESGFDVFALHGIFLPAFLRPTGYADMLEELERTCSRLGVPVHIFDLSELFTARVMLPFARAYTAGFTPNPCALCNAALKFGALLEKAEELGAAVMATGHYVRRENGKIYAGADPGKDQSYFLALTPETALAKAVFPLGGLRKNEVLAELARRGLTPPQKAESQEICFVPPEGYQALLPELAERFSLKLSGPGPIRLIDASSPGGPGGASRHVGKWGGHKGLWQYTEGQRRGLGLAYAEPLYVLGKDRADNALLVGPKASLGGRSCRCGELNFFAGPEEICGGAFRLFARTRYRQAALPVQAEFCGSGPDARMELVFERREDIGAPGQIAAVYALPGEENFDPKALRLMAGGIIEQTGR